MYRIHLRMLTVVPASRLRSRVLPEGTPKDLRLMVVHLTAAATSSMEAMVPVHAARTLAAARISARAVVVEKEIIDNDLGEWKGKTHRVRAKETFSVCF
jgi:hypothetical protein